MLEPPEARRSARAERMRAPSKANQTMPNTTTSEAQTWASLKECDPGFKRLRKRLDSDWRAEGRVAGAGGVGEGRTSPLARSTLRLNPSQLKYFSSHFLRSS